MTQSKSDPTYHGRYILRNNIVKELPSKLHNFYANYINPVFNILLRTFQNYKSNIKMNHFLE